MSFEAFEARINNIGNALDKLLPDTISVAIMQELESKYKNRIFDNGLKADGSKIGEYSTEPTYFSSSTFVRKAAFKPLGKPNAEGKQKRNKKTMFLQGGYSEFRGIQGRENQFINLKLSGSEERAFKTMKFGNSTLFGNTDQHESDKIQGQQDRFDGIFELSEDEKKFIREEITKQAILITKK